MRGRTEGPCRIWRVKTTVDQGEGSMTGKRRSEEDRDGGAEQGSKAGRVGRSEQEEVLLLPGPRLREGPVWRLPAGKGAPVSDNDRPGEALFRCEALLEQALSCSEYADVRFVFDDGESGVGGHRGMLCCVSVEFLGMFGSGMAEAKSGEVRVRGVGRASFRGFLEYLYLGRAGKEMGLADGREVWMLADLYGVQGLKDWLTGQRLWGANVLAATQFALKNSGLLPELLDVCKKFLASIEGPSEFGEEALRGLNAEAAGAVLEVFLARGKGGAFVNGLMLEGFRYVERWARSNGGLCYGSGDVALLVGLIDLEEVCPRDLLEVVRPSGLLREREADELYEARLRVGRLEGKRLGFVKTLSAGLPATCYPASAASSYPDAGQRVAVCDTCNDLVHVFDVASGACVLTVGWEGRGRPGCFSPCGVAFSCREELIVSDRLQGVVCVFDGSGGLVREMGTSGAAHERLSNPLGVAVNGEGDIIVADQGNHRVVVYRGDGAFVRSIGSRGRGDGQFDAPVAVAVGADGRTAVVDVGNRRVQVFDADGSHVVTIGGKGRGAGQFLEPCSAALSARGEILVMDMVRKDLQLFSSEGALLGCFGQHEISGVGGLNISGMCVDGEGRVFVCNSATKELLMLA